MKLDFKVLTDCASNQVAENVNLRTKSHFCSAIFVTDATWLDLENGTNFSRMHLV